MKFKCCESILHYLIISPSSLFLCCTPNAKKLLFLDSYHGGKIDVKNYILFRNNYIENCKKGIYPEPCQKCNLLKENDWDETLGLTSISISNRTFCSCHCIYCLLSDGGDDKIKNMLNSFKPYDVIPLLEQLYVCNLITKGCQIVIGGGECSEYPQRELEYFNTFVEKTSSKIIFFSSGINFSLEINNALKKFPSQLKIAVDAGSRDLYKKIKRVDKFELLWDNISRYSNTIIKNPESELILKYVIIPGVNDSLQEIESFIKRCKIVECSAVEVVVEHLWLNDNIKKKIIPKTLRDALIFFAKQKDIPIYFGISYADLWNDLKRDISFEQLPVV